MKLTDLIRVYDNVISKEDCEQIINEFDKRQQFLEYHDTPNYKFEQLNLNKNIPELSKSFAIHCCGYINDYFKSLNFDQYIGIQGFEEVRIKKYKKNSNYQFKPHIDAAEKNTSVRYLVFILYLNDNNGYTTFTNLNFKYKPKQGSLIIFPPHWMFPHSGEIPTDFDKYIMMSSLHHTNKT